jgi:hypothetical protein
MGIARMLSVLRNERERIVREIQDLEQSAPKLKLLKDGRREASSRPSQKLTENFPRRPTLRLK